MTESLDPSQVSKAFARYRRACKHRRKLKKILAKIDARLGEVNDDLGMHKLTAESFLDDAISLSAGEIVSLDDYKDLRGLAQDAIRIQNNTRGVIKALHLKQKQANKLLAGIETYIGNVKKTAKKSKKKVVDLEEYRSKRKD